jgi:serine/threonine protein kinase
MPKVVTIIFRRRPRSIPIGSRWKIVKLTNSSLFICAIMSRTSGSSFQVTLIKLRRIIHRDIKTANIFMDKDNGLKIGDFGISKSLDKTSLAATSMLGTPYYLSP